MTPDDVLPAAFAVVQSPKRYALLLGSGISRDAGIKTGWEITTDRIQKIAHGLGETIEGKPEDWYQQKYGNEPTFSNLFNGVDTPEDREAALREYFTVGGAIPQPTEAHRTIATMVKEGLISLIITTNFDDLLEQALRDEGIRPVVITEGSDPAKMSVIQDQCRIVKVNGDYPDTPLKMTPKDLASYTPTMTDYLDRIFLECGLIVCGWSAVDDTGLVEILTQERVRRHAIYWCHLEERGDIPDQIGEGLDVAKIPISSADEFFGELHRRTEILRKYQRNETLTPTLVVRKVKEALGQLKPELVLSDLINEETDRVLAFLADKSRYQADVIDGKEFYTTMLVDLEDVAAPLAAMVATVAQYDDGMFADLITDTIERLINVPPVTPEFSEIQNIERKTVYDYTEGLLELRYYPALLVIYASGVAAVRTRHFNTLEAIIRRPMKSRYNGILQGRVPYYEYVNPWTVIGFKSDWIVDLTRKRFGKERRYQDYPYQALQTFMKSLIPNQYAFIESLDVFEYILGLAYLASIKEREIEKDEFRSSIPGPLRSRHLYLRHSVILYPNEPLPPLPTHVINYLADLRQKTEGSTFFDGDFSTFEEANRKYAKGFGIEPPQVSKPSLAFFSGSRR